jgi:hypothetical protein
MTVCDLAACPCSEKGVLHVFPRPGVYGTLPVNIEPHVQALLNQPDYIAWWAVLQAITAAVEDSDG